MTTDDPASRPSPASHAAAYEASRTIVDGAPDDQEALSRMVVAATALGGGAHLRSLRRTSVGGFGLDEAGTIENPSLLPISAAVQHLESAVVDADTAVLVGHGRILALDVLGVTGEGPWSVLDEAGELLAVYEAHAKGGKPTVVIPR